MADARSPISGALSTVGSVVSPDRASIKSLVDEAQQQSSEQTNNLIREQNLALSSIANGLLTIRDKVTFLTGSLQSISGQLSTESFLEKQKILQDQQQERLLAQQQLREGKESEIEKKIESSLLKPVSELSGSVNSTLNNVGGMFLGLIGGWLGFQLVKQITGGADDTKDSFGNVKDKTLSMLGIIGGMFVASKLGITSMIGGVASLTGKITSAITKGLFKNPFSSLGRALGLGGRAESAAATRAGGGLSSLFGKLLGSINAFMNFKNGENVDGVMQTVMLILPAVGPLGVVKGLLGLGIAADQIAEIFGSNLFGENPHAAEAKKIADAAKEESKKNNPPPASTKPASTTQPPPAAPSSPGTATSTEQQTTKDKPITLKIEEAAAAQASASSAPSASVGLNPFLPSSSSGSDKGSDNMGATTPAPSPTGTGSQSEAIAAAQTSATTTKESTSTEITPAKIFAGMNKESVAATPTQSSAGISKDSVSLIPAQTLADINQAFTFSSNVAYALNSVLSPIVSSISGGENVDTIQESVPNLVTAFEPIIQPINNVINESVYAGMTTEQLKSMLRTDKAQSNEVFAATTAARQKAKELGLSPEETERQVYIAAIQASPELRAPGQSITPQAQITPVSQQVSSKVQGVGKLPEPAANVIVASPSAAATGLTPQQRSQTLATNVPNIPSGNPDNFYLAYSRAQYNIIAV